ncbi:hypothetical protein NDU88_003102 [Pleurodeles waltl]|uniref:Uncharacterized protein n=1 Tax=Pleurodeles waltl TaxID=8319 RepID=A0AAV7MQT7_PLEWA|nr:hypothetical protein NDU88_003102 [Pleurodeles waltl]
MKRTSWAEAARIGPVFINISTAPPRFQVLLGSLCHRYQEELEQKAGEDIVETLDAFVQHSINKALAAALRSIIA